MRKICILALVLLGACTSNNLAYLEDKQTLNGNTELLKVNSDICNQFKSTDKEFYSCGSGFSSDLELAKSKAILNAKINIADKISSTVVKNERQTIAETTKDGLIKNYSSDESNQIFETSLNRYVVVYDKSFLDSGKYRSFVVIKYQVNI
jgi:hypothetical protein